MQMTRRDFLVGCAISGLAASALTAPRFRFLVRLIDPIYPPSAGAVCAPWLDACAQFSGWHFDNGTYDRPLIRHRDTGLAYIALRESGAPFALQQIAPECCACRMDLDPDKIVGHAALRVFNHAFELSQRPEHWERQGVFFFSYDYRAPEPSLAPIIQPAPAMKLTPL